jgi:ribosome-binding protein aMBF1 (putative translation factor)
MSAGKKILFWQMVESRRRAVGMSRAELARRARISESTIFKGKQRGTRPDGRVREFVELVLAVEEQIARDERG